MFHKKYVLLYTFFIFSILIFLFSSTSLSNATSSEVATPNSINPIVTPSIVSTDSTNSSSHSNPIIDTGSLPLSCSGGFSASQIDSFLSCYGSPMVGTDSNFMFTVNKNNVEKNLVEIRRQVLIPISHTNISIQRSFASSENVSTADHLLLNVKNYVSPANLIFGQTNQVSGPTPEPTPIYLDEDSSIINYKNGTDVCPLDSINEYAYPQYGPDCSSDGYGKNQDSTFFEGVLQLMNIPVSQFAIDAFMLWKPYENTKACWNPLATTYHVSWFPPGTGCTETLFNSAGVRNYSSKYCGELATARTLLYSGSGNYYKPIRKMLAQESFDWQAIHDALNKWCNECYSDSLTNKWQMLWVGRGQISVDSVWTEDGNHNTKSTFNPGDTILYYGKVTNTTGSDKSAHFIWTANGPCGSIASWEGDLTTGAGTWNWYLPTSIPSDACGGTYTYSLSVTYNGSTSSKSTNFTVNGTSPSTPSNPSPSDGTTLSRTNDTYLSWNTNGSTCDIHIWGGAININPRGQSCSNLHLGIQYGGAYQWQVTAHNNYGTTIGPIWHFNVQPASPTNLNASTASSSQINLTWTKSSDDPGYVDNYNVYLGDGSLVTALNPGTTSYQVTGLNPATSYSFYLTSVRQGVESPPSNTASAITTSDSVSIMSAFTTDINFNSKTNFQVGDIIYLVGKIYNPTTSQQNIHVTWNVNGNCGSILSADANLDTDPGYSNWYLPYQLRAGICYGKYTLTITVNYQGQVSTQSTEFFVNEPAFKLYLPLIEK